uniref:DUF7890 domain-containing protein n=1 Tax=Cucumis sativus TaxID=3659 RepID=A0A0A0KZ22_CUCSA
MKKATYVYRDDLTKKNHSPPSSSSSPQRQSKEIKKVKKRVRFVDTEPEEEELEDETEKNVRIMVKLKKQEANQMLSRCFNGGVLEFGDVTFELMRIPPTRVSSSLVTS